MEEFNIKVLQYHFNVIIDNYKSKLRDNQMPYDYSRGDLIIDLHRLEMTEKKIYLHQLEPYQLAFFDIVKANEKYLRGAKKSPIINIQGERKRFCYQKENFAVLILIALSNKIDEIKNNYEEDIKKTTKSIKGNEAAVFTYFLIETGYIKNDNRNNQAAEGKRLLNTDLSKATILSRLNTIYSKKSETILRPNIIDNSMYYLKNYPKALKLAKETYDNY